MRKSVKISLRRFSLSDLSDILKIEQETFPKDAWSEKHFKFCHKNYPDGFIVAVVNGQVTGFAVGWISPKWGGIGDMAVVNRYKRRGIGKLLVNYILDWLKQKKCPMCRIEAKVDNQAALSFFQKVGFKKIKRLSKFYPSGEDAFLLTKKIN